MKATKSYAQAVGSIIPLTTTAKPLGKYFIVDRHVELEESSTIEFKSNFLTENYPAYRKTMCAFLNTNGGHLIFGINDDGIVHGMQLVSKIKGQKKVGPLQESTHTKAFDRFKLWVDMTQSQFFNPPVRTITVDKQFITKTRFIWTINVPKANRIISLENKTYVRLNASTVNYSKELIGSLVTGDISSNSTFNRTTDVQTNSSSLFSSASASASSSSSSCPETMKKRKRKSKRKKKASTSMNSSSEATQSTASSDDKKQTKPRQAVIAAQEYNKQKEIEELFQQQEGYNDTNQTKEMTQEDIEEQLNTRTLLQELYRVEERYRQLEDQINALKLQLYDTETELFEQQDLLGTQNQQTPLVSEQTQQSLIGSLLSKIDRRISALKNRQKDLCSQK